MTTPTNSDFVGLADTIYRKSDLENGSSLTINGARYVVLDVINHSSSNGYYGAVLYDDSTNTLFVVNRGTEPTNWQDWATDAVMAETDQNLQWQDADALAQFASQYATTNGSTVYTVGHSLGGTLAQMQAAINGWTGVTFNAYGSGEVLAGLGYSVDPNQPNITNYRTLFDLVSEASTQIGNVVTLETPNDKAFLMSSSGDPVDLGLAVGSDHFISNFYDSQSSDPVGKANAGQAPTYVAASMFASPAPTDLATNLAQNAVMGFGKVLAATRETAIQVGKTTTVGQVANAILEWYSAKYLSGETAVMPAGSSLLQNALNPSLSDNAYRASLVAGSPVLLQGIDPSEVQDDTLWSPGQASGLTKDYLIARNAMVQAGTKLAGQDYPTGGTGTSDDGNTYVYTDLTLSSDPLYTLTGTGPDTYAIEFGTDGEDALSPTAGALSELFGGAGDDVLTDGAGKSTLEGGAGDDQYWVDGTQAGTDHILDTDGQGNINWELPGGGSPILTGGDAVPGGSEWKSADGSFTYTELAATDGTTELEIHSGAKTVYVDGFTNGDLGITLDNANTTTPGTGNLGNFTATTYSDHTEYQDFSGTAGGDSMVGVATTGGHYNVLEGEGNASNIYAGNGNNDVFVNDTRNSPVGEVFSYPLSVAIQGGSGNQLLVGMGDDGSNGNGNETILGGDMGSSTTAWTTIDGGGAYVNALLSGGGQNSLILGGIGTDTITAGSATAGSGNPDPTTIALAGLSYWAAQSQTATGGGSITVTGEPQVSIPTFTDPANFQIDIALQQLDGSYATPFGLLGSSSDSGTDDNGGWSISGDSSWTLPGSLMIGGSGEDYLIGNSGDDTLVGGAPAHPTAGVIDEVLVGGGGANMIYGGSGTELIFADLSPGADTSWADLNPGDADTIYGGTGSEFIYGSGGNDVIYGGSGNYTINTGNGNAYVETGSGSTIVNGGNGNDTFIAGGGVYSIITGDGDDSVYSGDGQSTISAGSGNDTFEAGSGSTTYNAGTGQESYQIGVIAGDETIVGGSSADSIDVTYTDGITSDDVVANQDATNDLLLTNKQTGSHLQINGYFNGESNVSVYFSDGVTWDTNDLLQAASDGVVGGTTDNDDIVGTAGNDYIDGKGGVDIAYGNGGNDTFVFDHGYGALEIGPENGYTIKLNSTSASVYRSNSHSGQDVILEADGGEIRLDGMYSGGNGLDPSSNIVQFSDGHTATVAQLASEITQWNAGGLGGSFGKQSYRLDESSSDESLYHAAYAAQIDVYYMDGIASTGVTARGDTSGNLTLTNKSTGSIFVLPGYFGPPIQGRGAAPLFVHFSDGVTWNAAQILQQYVIPDDGDDVLVGSNGNATITGGPGDDTIVGVKGNNVLTGGTGNSTIEGGSGADTIEGGAGTNDIRGGTGSETYLFNVGDGSDTITENTSTAGTDTFKFGSGISVADATFSLDSSNDLLITLGAASASTVDIADFTTTGGSLHQIGTFEFADGATYTRDQVLQLASGPNSTGTVGDDLLVGTSGADLLDGEGGNDTAVGNGGNDTFVFDAGYGHLEINESYSSGQQPSLQLGASIAASIVAVSADGDDLVLTDGTSGDQITLAGMWSTSGDGVASVHFADGSALTASQLRQIEMTGTAGDDTIYGTPSADLLDGMGGTDSMVGEGGDDTFVFNVGYGHLEVSETYGAGQEPVLQLGMGIATSTLHVIASGNNLVLTDGTSGDQVTLDGMWSTTGAGVAEVQFADGSALTASQLRQMEMTGTTGNETIYGTAGDDLIDGKGGVDIEYGNGGNDTFIFNSNYDYLLISNSYSSGQQPVLQLGPGIALSDIRVTESDYSLILTNDVNGSQIYLSSEGIPDSNSGVAIVRFADGSTLTAAQLQQMEMIGTAGDETIYGTSNADLLDGKGGNDSVIGDGGDDTFVFNSGYGLLEVNESYGDGQEPVLQLGSGIAASMLHVIANGSNLVLTDGISGDQVTLDDMWSANGAGVAAVQLADGSTLTKSQLQQMEMTGSSVDETIFGTPNANLLDGKGGNDSLIGDGGDDTFVFNPGYGHLEIFNGYFSGQHPVLQLGDGIAATALVATTSGNDLVLTDGVAGDQITLFGMATYATNGVESVDLADGTVITRSQLIQMTQDTVEAQASAETDPAVPQDAPAGNVTPTADDFASVTQTSDASTSATSLMPNTNAASSSPSSTPAVDIGTDTSQPERTAQTSGTPDVAADARYTPSSTQAVSPATDIQSPSTSSDANQYGSAQPSPSSFDTELQSAVAQAQAQPEREADPVPGAPADPLMNDPDDVGAQTGALSAGAGGHAAQRPLVSAGWNSAFASPSGQQRRAFNAAYAADGMTRALTAQGGLGAPNLGLDLGRQPADQIQLQGGTTWSLTTLDRTMAALAPTGATDGSADRAHALLASAMTSFAPMTSAESSPLLSSLPSEAYAIAAAA